MSDDEDYPRGIRRRYTPVHPMWVQYPGLYDILCDNVRKARANALGSSVLGLEDKQRIVANLSKYLVQLSKTEMDDSTSELVKLWEKGSGENDYHPYNFVPQLDVCKDIMQSMTFDDEVEMSASHRAAEEALAREKYLAENTP